MAVAIDQREWSPHEAWLRDMETGEWLCPIPVEMYAHLERLIQDADERFRDVQKELMDLKEGRTAVLPKTREHAQALLSIADACLNGNGTMQPLPR